MVVGVYICGDTQGDPKKLPCMEIIKQSANRGVTEVYTVLDALLRTALLQSESKSDNPLYPASAQIRICETL